MFDLCSLSWQIWAVLFEYVMKFNALALFSTFGTSAAVATLCSIFLVADLANAVRKSKTQYDKVTNQDMKGQIFGTSHALLHSIFLVVNLIKQHNKRSNKNKTCTLI